MADAEHPTIPQIVRALITIEDRHSDALKALRAQHEQELKKLRDSGDTLDRALLYRDCLVDELETVIATLCSRIERVQRQLKSDNQQCVYSEPLELMNLLGRRADPTPLINDARSRARRAKNAELERQKKANREPSHAEKVAEAKRTTVWPIAPVIPASTPPMRECACGKRWAASNVPSNHNGLECQPEDCPTVFNGGLCAGTKGHPGRCTPNADDIPSAQEAMEAKCRICGHDDGRHGHTLPEEGRKPQCFECSWADENHEFDGTKAQPEDECNCGHPRKRHVSGPGEQCLACPGDDERSWRHEFFMAPKLASDKPEVNG